MYIPSFEITTQTDRTYVRQPVKKYNPKLKARRNARKRPYLALPDGWESASFFFGGYGFVLRLFSGSGMGFKATRCRSSDVVMVHDRNEDYNAIRGVPSHQLCRKGIGGRRGKSLFNSVSVRFARDSFRSGWPDTFCHQPWRLEPNFERVLQRLVGWLVRRSVGGQASNLKLVIMMGSGENEIPRCLN